MEKEKNLKEKEVMAAAEAAAETGLISIAGVLNSTTVDQKLAKAKQIWDDWRNDNQESINSMIFESIEGRPVMFFDGIVPGRAITPQYTAAPDGRVDKVVYMPDVDEPCFYGYVDGDVPKVYIEWRNVNGNGYSSEYYNATSMGENDTHIVPAYGKLFFDFLEKKLYYNDYSGEGEDAGHLEEIAGGGGGTVDLSNYVTKDKAVESVFFTPSASAVKLGLTTADGKMAPGAKTGTIKAASTTQAGVMTAEMVKTLNDVANALYKQYTKIATTQTVWGFEKGVSTKVDLTWKLQYNGGDVADGDIGSMKMAVGGVDKVTDKAVKSYSDTVTDSRRYYITAVFHGVTVTGSVSVTAYNPVFTGGSAKDALAAADILAMTKKIGGAGGNYTIALAADGYLYVCVPKGNTVNKVVFDESQGGFPIPMEPVKVVTGVGVASGAMDYNVYRCSAKQKAGTYKIVVS